MQQDGRTKKEEGCYKVELLRHYFVILVYVNKSCFMLCQPRISVMEKETSHEVRDCIYLGCMRSKIWTHMFDTVIIICSKYVS